MTEPRWTRIAEFPSLVDAEFAAGRLESAGIASLLQQQGNVGIFGPGFSGPTAAGVRLLVSEADLAAARTALDMDEVTEG